MKPTLPTLSSLAGLFAALGKDFVRNVADFAFDEAQNLDKSPKSCEVIVPHFKRSPHLRVVNRTGLRQARRRFFRKISSERPDLNRAQRRALMKQVRFA